ncbi:response regulator [Candidatus Woesearchaeota archaeon]|nr:response regulator [Candidatus Woesearchaeota archaeon]
MKTISVRKKILLVEDSFATASAVKILLESKDYYVEYAHNGQKALELIKVEDYNLILLDLMMPEVTGMDVLKVLKENEKTKNIPVIIITARMDLLKWEAITKQANEIIRKPFDNAALLASIEKYLNNT